jgi:hypothetical protein
LPELNTVYYLPGHGGQLAKGLGQGLLDRGFDVTGRETRGDFRALPFDEQIQTIMDDLQDHFWHAQAQVICNSFGSYLFLHAQAQMPSFTGRVLLLSPIVGEFTSDQNRTTFSPPRPADSRSWPRPVSSTRRRVARFMSGKKTGKAFRPMYWPLVS